MQHLASVLTADLADARADMAAPLQEIERFRRYLQARQPRKDPPWPGASELVAPYAKQAINALLAEVAPALLNVAPLARFSCVGDDMDLTGAASAPEQWEEFYEALYRRKTGFRQTARQWFHRAFIDSTAVLQVTWEARREWRTAFRMQGRPYGETALEPVRAVSTVYDWPRFDIIPIEQFTVFPSANANIQQSAGVAARFEVQARTLLDGARAGLYSRDAVLKTLELHGAGDGVRSPDDRQHRVGEQNSDTARVRQTVPLTECYWRMPGKQGDRDEEDDRCPADDWLITLHEPSGTVLRAHPTPWWHGQRPFVLCRPYPDSGGVLGDSILSAGAAHVQDAKTVLLRLAIDAMALGINPRLLVAASMYNKAREALVKGNRPGGLIPLPDQMLQQRGPTLQPLINGYNPQAVIPLLELLDSESQRIFPDAGAGAQMSGKPTATEVQQVWEGASKVIGAVVEECADAMGEVLRQSHGLVMQFVGRDSVRQLWQQVNGTQSLPIELAAQSEYDIEANGTSETANAAVKAARANLVAQVMADEPQVMGNATRRYHLKQYVLQRNGVSGRDLDNIMGTVNEWQQEDGQAGLS